MRLRGLAAVVLSGSLLGGCCSGGGNDPISGALCLASAPVLIVMYASKTALPDNPRDDRIPMLSLSPEELKARAKEGDPIAQYVLSLATDDIAARRAWICRSANQGYRYAQFGFGSMQSDPVKTFMWYRLAESNGHPTATYYLDDLGTELTAEEVAEAERLVAEWKPDPASCELDATPLQE